MEKGADLKEIDEFKERMEHLMNNVLAITGYRIKNDLDMSLSGVYSIMNGKVKPGMDFITKFCTFYGVSANYFILGIEPALLKDVETTKNHYTTLVSKEINNLINKLEEFKAKL